MFNKIGIKLIVAVGITAVVTIGVFSFFNIQSQSNALLSEVERHANQLSETVKSSTRYDMLLNQRDRIDKTVISIGKQPGIRNVRILNKLGEIIYSSHKEDIGQLVDKKAESCYACHEADKPLERLPIKKRTRIYKINPDSSRILGIISPIYNERSCWEADCHAHSKEKTILGVLDVTTSLSEADNQIKRGEIEIVIFALAAVIALSLIIGFLVRRWIDKPVNELLKATDQVGVGNLNYTIKEKGNDEIGRLARSFNTMTQKLSEARMQLFQSDKMASLGRLAAGVAHEINNPLTGVLTYSSFLMKRTQNNPEMLEDLKVIVRETKRSREIVKSLLDFARQSVPKKNEVEINEIIEHSITVVENQLTINKVKLEKRLDKNLPRTVLDANQIQQVIINLIVNANDAIGKNGGTISVSTSLISLSPYGVAQVKKATCQKRHDLIDNEFKIEGLPSIKLKAKLNSDEKIVHLDPVYGRRAHQYLSEFDENKKLNILCPECSISMIDESSKCPKCGSQIFSIQVLNESNFEACTRVGCDYQKWESVDEKGKKDYIEIKISDTGCGIPKEDISKIFEPFFSTKGQKGTGLGLAVIWGIIDNHNGTIKVESEINKGTRFIIRLPLKQR
ncbi:MAG TPA: ATP-binding protein [Ignavibacteriaceae bacterium]|nr:ATP-binding protein [Ignavibacteriaceae bacterium]